MFFERLSPPGKSASVARLRPGVRIATRRLGEEVVVFDEVSGDCHLLSLHAFQALRSIAMQTSDGTQSVECIRPFSEAGDYADRPDPFLNESLITELARTGLIEPAARGFTKPR